MSAKFDIEEQENILKDLPVLEDLPFSEYDELADTIDTLDDLDNELVISNGALTKKALETVAYYETKIKKDKEDYEEFKKKVKEEMEKQGLTLIETDSVKISYVAPSVRRTFDSKKFQQDNPNEYLKYLKSSEIDSSIKIKVK